MLGTAVRLEQNPISRELDPSKIPHHVGIVLDGNRRWARAHQLNEVSDGHRIGFGKLPDVLSWCDGFGIKIVTLWMLSTDNIRSRATAELDALYEIDEDVVRRLVAGRRFRLKAIGCLDMLPERLATVLREAETSTAHIKGMLVNLAIAYGGREDLLRGISSLVNDVLATGNSSVTQERFSAHLSTAGQPDPDLVIRTSGECRTSGFLLWQSALAELYFCQCDWPDFSQSELLRALQTYATRNRRFGS